MLTATTVSEPARIAFVGDCRVPDEASTDDVWVDVRPWLQDANLVVVNLEGPLGRAGAPRLGRGALLANHEGALKTWHFVQNRLFVLANNHIMDYGADALVRTIETIRADGAQFVGAGLDEDDARQPVILQVGSKRAGFLAYTTTERHVGSICAVGSNPGCADLFSSRTLDEVAALSRQVDLACVLLHWGHEFHAYPSPSQVEWTEKLTRAGAKVLVGHHPHVIQGVCAQQNSVIAHSLGNGYFPPFHQTNGRLWIQSRDEREFLLLKVEIDTQNTITAETLAGRRDRRQRLRPYCGLALRQHRERLARLSAPLRRRDYHEFYAGYAATRAHELRRGAIWKSIRKVRWRDLHSVRGADFFRLWKRIAG